MYPAYDFTPGVVSQMPGFGTRSVHRLSRRWDSYLFVAYLHAFAKARFEYCNAGWLTRELSIDSAACCQEGSKAEPEHACVDLDVSTYRTVVRWPANLHRARCRAFIAAITRIKVDKSSWRLVVQLTSAVLQRAANCSHQCSKTRHL